MSSSEQLLEAIRRKHGRNLERLRRKALSDAATTAEMSGTGPGRKLPPRYETRSVLDNTLEVRILASHDPIDDDVVIVGNYPAGSKLVFISVSARHARTGSIATIDPTEADAWGASLAPEGYDEFVVKLGQIATSPSKATRYRQIVGPDNHLCAIDERDRTAMLATAQFIGTVR